MFDHAQPGVVLKHTRPSFVLYPGGAFAYQNLVGMSSISFKAGDKMNFSQNASPPLADWDNQHLYLENIEYTGHAASYNASSQGYSRPHPRQTTILSGSSFGSCMSHDQIARNGYEANPLNTSSAPQMRTKFELAEANAQRARYSNQHSSISASPLPHISTRDIFDAGSSHSGNTVDTSNSGHAAEIPFAQNLRLENNSHILATGYSTALWPSTLLQTGTPATAGANLHNTTGQDWWQNPLHCAPKGTFQAQYGMSPHHGLPQYAEERFTSVWSYGPDLCTTQMITMNQPQVQTFGYDAPMAMSTSDSSQGSISDSYAASTYEQSLQDDDDNESFTTQQRRDLPSSHSDREYHTKAPDCKAAQRHVPVLPNNNHALKTEDGDEWQARKKGTRSTMSEGAVTYSIHMGDQSPQVTSTKSKTGRSRAARHSWNAGDKLAVVDEKKQDRTEKDTFLIQSKLAGMSYKEIRRKGNFTEAESTLRGRFRTLTKHKAARVRKPEWDENDDRLLRRAVRKFARSVDPSRAKIPWKLVAEYIADHGGSYHFGNATCRKRWDDISGSG